VPVLATDPEQRQCWFALSDRDPFVEERDAAEWTPLIAPREWRGTQPKSLIVLHD
jgi:hypothetical protein